MSNEETQKTVEYIYQESDEDIVEEELRFPDDEDVIEYINERIQEALNARKRGEKFYRLEELQREFLGT